MIDISREKILEETRDNGYFIRRNVEMSRQDFLNFCNHVGTPWTKEIHAIHKEGWEEDEIVHWSNQSNFKGVSIPWHADNPYHPDYKFPMRILYGSSIPHPDKDTIYFLNTTKWFEDQDEDTKQRFRNLQVLTQDYKGGWQPFWSSLIKKHPITNKENFFWGAMALQSDVFGVTADEGLRFPHFSYTMAIQKENRELISHEEISSWFQSMMNDNYLFKHNWNQNDVIIIDNWIGLHYVPNNSYKEKRLLWRKTILQPWQKIIG